MYGAMGTARVGTYCNLQVSIGGGGFVDTAALRDVWGCGVGYYPLRGGGRFYRSCRVFGSK